MRGAQIKQMPLMLFIAIAFECDIFMKYRLQRASIQISRTRIQTRHYGIAIDHFQIQ